MRTDRKFWKKTLAVIASVLCCCFLFASCGLFIKSQAKPRVETHETYTAYFDVAYGKHERQTLDLYLPKTDKKEVGLMLFIHGGGWMAGEKEGYGNVPLSWCERGYAAAAINYRYANLEMGVDVWEILDDITSSLLKIKEVARGTGLAVEKAILQGGSAGAHLSLLYSYTRAEIAPITPVAVCSYAGPTDLLDENYYAEDNVNREAVIKMFKNLCGYSFGVDTLSTVAPFLAQASPVTYVRENTVPTIICQGLKDDVVVPTNGTALQRALEKFGVEHETVFYPNSGHGLESDPDKTAESDAVLLEYVQRYLP